MATSQEINALFTKLLGRPANAGELQGFAGLSVNDLRDRLSQTREQILNPQARPVEYGQGIIDELTGRLRDESLPITSFDKTGLYDQNEALALGRAEFDPYFKEQQGELDRSINTTRNRTLQDYSKSLRDALNQTSSNFENRGLLRSGGYNAARSNVRSGVKRAQDRSLYDISERQRLGTKDIEDKRQEAVTGFTNKLYNRKLNEYLRRTGR